jgi:hypothetical protein
MEILIGLVALFLYYIALPVACVMILLVVLFSLDG